MILVLTSVSWVINSAYGFKEQEYKTITVRQGDTLWSIANDYIAKGDTRENVYKIKHLNNLKDSSIYDGLELKIPIE